MSRPRQRESSGPVASREEGDYHWLKERSATIVVGFGVVLFVLSVAHHAAELYAFDGTVGPLLAVILDGGPALGLAYAGYWLARTDLDAGDRWTVCVWSLVGIILFVSVMGSTVLVRTLEGRVIAEPIFPLLVAAGAGGIAGFVAGYYNARSQAEARQARTVTDAFAFVNSLLRHDLRNDLTVVRGRAELLEADGGPADGEPASANARAIVGKADEAIARIETTDAIAETLVDEPALRTVDLAGMTAEMVDRLRETSAATVAADLPDRAPVAGNAGLRSVVDNLLENALEHNDAEDPRIDVRIERDGGIIRLSVRDNGPGIPDEKKETLFDAAGDRARGSGLHLVGTLVERYGGNVWVEGNDPRGTIFVVELPRAEAGAE